MAKRNTGITKPPNPHGTLANLRNADDAAREKAIAAVKEKARLRKMWDLVAEQATNVEQAVKILQTIAAAAEDGDMQAAKLYFDRVFGAVATKVITEDEDGNTMPVSYTFIGAPLTPDAE